MGTLSVGGKLRVSTSSYLLLGDDCDNRVVVPQPAARAGVVRIGQVMPLLQLSALVVHHGKQLVGALLRVVLHLRVDDLCNAIDGSHEGWLATDNVCRQWVRGDIARSD